MRKKWEAGEEEARRTHVERGVEHRELGPERVGVLDQRIQAVFPELSYGEHLRVADLVSDVLDELRDEASVGSEREGKGTD